VLSSQKRLGVSLLKTSRRGGGSCGRRFDYIRRGREAVWEGFRAVAPLKSDCYREVATDDSPRGELESRLQLGDAVRVHGQHEQPGQTKNGVFMAWFASRLLVSGVLCRLRRCVHFYGSRLLDSHPLYYMGVDFRASFADGGRTRVSRDAKGAVWAN
jgi:hypothetical protein